MNWLNYHHLFYFWIIAREGTIARAAERLGLGQPTLSAQLKLLEENLGRPLFERAKGRLVLTDSGRVALEYANEIFRLGEEMVEALQDRLPASRVHLQLGALDSVPKNVILELVQFAYRAGDCTVSILEGKGDELFRELFAHRLDVILSNYPPAFAEEGKIYAKAIAKIPVVVCALPSMAHLKKGFPGSLKGQPFVLSTRHSKLRHDLDHFFASNGIHINPVAETQDTSLQQLMGLTGVGLIPINERAARDLVKARQWIQLGTLEGVYEEIWLISGSRKIDNPIAAQLMKGLRLT